MLWRDLSCLVNDMDKLCAEEFSFLMGKDAEGERKKEPARSDFHAVPWQGKKLARLLSFWDWQAQRKCLFRVAEGKKIMKRIEEKVDLGVQGISILGNQGAGKTFLARWVYREASYQSFEWRAWVHVSTCKDQREFLLEILKQVEPQRMEEKSMTLPKITQMLREKFIKTKRFLIVLDDVGLSEEQLLLSLAMIIPHSSLGHIITTTQDARIARIMNFEAEPIELTYLSPQESRKMLAMNLHGVPDVQRLTQEENRILMGYPRLPLFISLLGRLISYAGDQERMELLKDSFVMSLVDILQLSYDRLPVYLKPCFIYMALFPIASVIPTRRLLRLWLAEGLLDSHSYDEQRERTRTPEEVGEIFILELADRNVIDVVSWRADGSPKAFQMLTTLYDMILPTALSTGFLHVHAATPDPPGQQQQLPAHLQRGTEVRWLAEHTNMVIDGRSGSFNDFHLGHVRSFLSFYLRRGLLTEDVSTILKSMTSKTVYSMLRVLDLEGVYKPSLQCVLHKLVLLRYLGLRRTMLESLPSTVADLHYLETLDIKHTNIASLPSSFWKARNLRHLHLHWFCINLKKIVDAGGNNAMALSKLQTLSGLVIGDVKEKSIVGLMCSMTTLTTLKLFLKQSDGDTSGAAWVTVAHWISFGLTSLQALTLGVIYKAMPTKEDEPAEEDKPAKEEAKPATLQVGPLPVLSLAERHHNLLELYLLGHLNEPSWTQRLPASLRVLTLSGSRVEVDMMPELGGLLKHLRTFRLLANSFLCTSLRFAKDGFPSLVILKIWKLPRLEKVIIEEGAMLHLKELEFRHIDRIKIVEGIKECMELENICVVVEKGAHGFVDHLKREIGRRTSLYKIEDTKINESTDDDDRDEDASP